MKWISIEDQLPKEDRLYLIYAISGDIRCPLITTAWFDPRDKRWSFLPIIWIDAITHWMPLPEPPV